MSIRSQIVSILVLFINFQISSFFFTESKTYSLPPVQVSIYVQNWQLPLLPQFFGLFENLQYDRDEMEFYVRCGRVSGRKGSEPAGSESLIEAIQAWVDDISDSVADVDFEPEFVNDLSQFKQDAIKRARSSGGGIDRVWFIRPNVFLNDTKTLMQLIAADAPIVAPVLMDIQGEKTNLGGLKASQKRTSGSRLRSHKNSCFRPEFNFASPPIYDSSPDFPFCTIRRKSRQHQEIYAVPELPDVCVLINLARVDEQWLREQFYGREKMEARTVNGEPSGAAAPSLLWLSNVTKPAAQNKMLNGQDENAMKAELRQFILEFVQKTSDFSLVPLSPPFEPYQIFLTTPGTEHYGFDQVYVINLARRPERRERAEKMLSLVNLKATFWNAVDAKNLSEEDLEANGISVAPGYLDPFEKRPMKLGEIACFLSHNSVWEDMVAKGYESAIILEDDAKFKPNFVRQLQAMMDDIRSTDTDWDVIYLGRKRFQGKFENRTVVTGGFRHRYLADAPYSHWNVGVAYSLSGVKKLLAADPLSKMVPVDEFVPIMIGQHFYQPFNDLYPKRDLIAYTAEPLILEPMLYNNQQNYISDTEDSVLMSYLSTTTETTPSDNEQEDEEVEDRSGTDTTAEL